MAPDSSARGFTLLETLIATGILITALAGVAQLFALGNQLAKKGTASGVALLAAQTKLETLQGLTFSFNANGDAESDPHLAPSPEHTLNEDTPPYLDWLDQGGEPIDSAAGAAFVRRWRILRFDDQEPDSISIEVCVFAAAAGAAPVSAADACLSTLRTRQP